MRRSSRPLLLMVLIASGLPLAAGVGALTNWVVRSVDLPSIVQVVVVGLATLVELVWVSTHRLRPWAVNRQVPQSWGHEHGPWKAALRYSPRLALGPATILTSWSWWAGLALGALLGMTGSLLFAVGFVVLRSTVTMVVPGNPSDGLVLAQSMNRLRAFERPSSAIGVFLMCVALALVAVHQWG